MSVKLYWEFIHLCQQIKGIRYFEVSLNTLKSIAIYLEENRVTHFYEYRIINKKKWYVLCIYNYRPILIDWNLPDGKIEYKLRNKKDDFLLKIILDREKK